MGTKLKAADFVTVGDSTGETVSLGEIAGLHTNAQLVLDPIHKQNTESDQSDDTRLYQLAKSPIRFNKVEESLINYPRKYETIELIEGLKHGFPRKYSGTRLPFNTKNLCSVYERPDLVKAKIRKEVSLGRVCWSFCFSPFPTFKSLLNSNSTKERWLLSYDTSFVPSNPQFCKRLYC
jgi:hypothetical protein